MQQIRSPKEESFSNIKKEINNLFNLPAKERDEQRDRLAAKGYGPESVTGNRSWPICTRV